MHISIYAVGRRLRPCAGVMMLMVLSTPLAAQDRGVSLTLRSGIANPSDRYQSSCGYSSIAFSADVQSRGQIFPQLSVDYHAGAGGNAVGCVLMHPDSGTVVGGLQLEHSTRLSAGVGARLGSGNAYMEGVVRGGVMSGRWGYVPSLGYPGTREYRPHIGGQLSAVLFRAVVLSGNVHWTRLSFDRVRPNGGGTTTTTDWEPLVTMQAGVRIPLWRGRAAR